MEQRMRHLLHHRLFRQIEECRVYRMTGLPIQMYPPPTPPPTTTTTATTTTALAEQTNKQTNTTNLLFFKHRTYLSITMNDVEAPTSPDVIKTHNTESKSLEQARNPSANNNDDDDDDDNNNNKKRNWTILTGIIAVLVLVGTGVGVGVALSGSGSSTSTSENQKDIVPDNFDSQDPKDDPDPSISTPTLDLEVTFYERSIMVNGPTDHDSIYSETVVIKADDVGQATPHLKSQWAMEYLPNRTEETSQGYYFDYLVEYEPTADKTEEWTFQLESVNDGTATIAATLTIRTKPRLGLLEKCEASWAIQTPVLVAGETWTNDEIPWGEPSLNCDFGEPVNVWRMLPGAVVQVYVPPPQYQVDIEQYYAFNNAWTGYSFGPVTRYGTSGPVEVQGEAWEDNNYRIFLVSVDAVTKEAVVEVISYRGDCKNPDIFTLTAVVDSGSFGGYSEQESCYDTSDTSHVQKLKAKVSTL
mmetsp:Transcript_17568/g.32984  ORF Transcript_17568/g.32984 Transcript_17568/m.32984 type:complete len:471 (-) Transcript_17568:45-1457(-)